jgi:hypothetical protein
MAVNRQRREQAVRVRVPLPGDELPPGTPPAAARASTASTASAGAGGAVDVVAALERLRVLHEQGALSDQEFAAAKAAVLRQDA